MQMRFLHISPKELNNKDQNFFYWAVFKRNGEMIWLFQNDELGNTEKKVLHTNKEPEPTKVSGIAIDSVENIEKWDSILLPRFLTTPRMNHVSQLFSWKVWVGRLLGSGDSSSLLLLLKPLSLFSLLYPLALPWVLRHLLPFADNRVSMRLQFSLRFL